MRLQRRNSIYFSSSLRCFNFLATPQTTITNQLVNLLQTLTKLSNLTRTTEARTRKPLQVTIKKQLQFLN